MKNKQIAREKISNKIAGYPHTESAFQPQPCSVLNIETL